MKHHNQNKISVLREWIIIVMLLVAYSILSFVSLDWYAVSTDEPGYTDPSASLLLGQGFTSGAWYAQGYDELWAGNVPLHQFFLYLWIKCFGFHLEVVRAINIVYVLIGSAALWLGVRNLKLINSAELRIAVVLLIIASHAGAIWVNVARPDAICYAIGGIMLYAFSLENSAVRRGSLLLLSLVSIWASIPLALVIGFLGIGLLFVNCKRFTKDVVFLSLGGFLGAVLLVTYYIYHGELDSFIQSLLPHSQILGKKSQFIAPQVSGLKHKLGGLTDYTFLCLLAACGFTWLNAWRIREVRKWWCANVIAAIGVPLLLFGAGVFPNYYAWFSFVPTIITCFGLWERFPSASRMIRILVILALCGILPLGFLRVWANGLIYRHDKINQKTEVFVSSVIKSDDVVLCQAQPWYAAKKKAKRVYQGFKTPNLTASEESEITVVICNEKFFHAQREILKGEWKETGEKLSLPNRNTHRLPFSQWFRDNPTIDLHVFRRVHH